MPSLPSAAAFTNSASTEGDFKSNLTQLRAYLSTLLGDAGTAAAANVALATLLNGTISKTSAYTVVAADRGKLVNCTGNWTLAIDPVATLGAGFTFSVRNGGNGVITINPYLGETINGALTLILSPGESCAVVTTAAADGWLSALTGGGGGATGQIGYFAVDTAPNGWLKANGATVSRTDYAALWSVIGPAFGDGDGVNTFTLPDLRGEFIRAWSDGHSVDSGRAFGSAQAGSVQSHSHTFAGGGTGYSAPGFYYTGASELTPYQVATSAEGGAETRPRNIALLACIKY